MPPSGAAYNIDWVWSFDSNTHVATHRDWFTTFTPLTSQISSTHISSTYSVEGIGSVEIEVRRIIGNAAKRNVGPKNSKVVLRNVLYVPDFICNVMGNTVREDYDISIGAERWIIDKKTGRGIGMLDKNPAGLVKILLKGQAKGETGLKGDVPARITVEWSDEEQQKYKAQKEA
ncbi:uncharacterized protein CC84DRAFT_1169650 [Paraphaeosphaeria sporulosa]|uniref:Retrovirus-related Pol polyprotein from transposon TNT 1-94-like beta-barrel domain-containing protein n=1 Tax=Paraphaeosphaeria sporulosa TaxID=1460663 RepID=A0A177BVZ7_9PLEO|nr:uncharacterized protein CC84DRAFT_1169650 [Paraphaeosphaeria sporulosa]OAF98911.1 hypothetical protein CC84DRAFT_1169650 [Paraphaeosphaeria sporulosa]